MYDILLRMAHLESYPAVWREASLPNILTLKSLSLTIQEEFALGSEGTIEYEVLGCRAPGHRVRLRDLLASGITRFCYLQNGARPQRIEIVIVPPTRINREGLASMKRPPIR